MASTANAFDLLSGAEAALNSSKKKKKSTGANSGANPKAAGAGSGSSDAAQFTAPSSGVVDIGEALAILERAAREAKTIADKCKLWKDWTKQGSGRGGSGLKYRNADGSFVDFKEVLLRSKALEITLESAVGSVIPPEREEPLTTLIATFLPSAPHGFSHVLMRISSLIENEAIDTRSAAQRAVHNVVCALKSGNAAESGASDNGSAVSSWLTRISYLDKEISKQQGLLNKLTQGSRGVISKEQASIAKLVYSLTEEKFDMLQPGAIPSLHASASGPREAAERSIDELRRIINAHLKTTGGDQGGKGRGAGVAQGAQAQLATIKKEEQYLAQQAESVASQIRTLEAQLRSLRSQQADIEERRAQLQQRQRVAQDPVGKGRGQGAFSTAHYHEELTLAEALSAAVDPSVSGGASSQQVATVQAACSGVPLEYLAGGQHYLQVTRSLMAEIPQRVAFCKQRLSQADKLLRLGGEAKENNRMKEDAEKLMAEAVKSAEEFLRSSLQVTTQLHQRAEAAARASGHSSAVPEMLGTVDTLMAEIRSAYDVVQAALQPAAVPAAAPAQQQQQHVQQHGQTRPASAPVSNGAAKAAAPAASPAAPTTAPTAAAAPAANGGPKSAFDVAAAYLASARPPSAKAAPAPVAAPAAASKPESNGSAKRAPPAPAAASAPAPAAAPASASTSSAGPRLGWAKLSPGAPASQGSGEAGDSSLPTPAEAFKAAEPAAAVLGPSSAAGGSSQKKKQQQRQKA